MTSQMKTIRKKDGNTLLQCVNTMVEVLRTHQVQLVTWEYVGAAFRSISAAAPQKMSVRKQNPSMLNRMLKFLHVSGDGELGWNPNGANVAWNLLDTMSTLLIDAIGGE